MQLHNSDNWQAKYYLHEHAYKYRTTESISYHVLKFTYEVMLDDFR
jgi:hypothetical protein